jgi:hypothetical protein
MNSFIGRIIHADEGELKKLCQDKKTRIYGKAAMKHKYAWALLENYILKLNNV